MAIATDPQDILKTGDLSEEDVAMAIGAEPIDEGIQDDLQEDLNETIEAPDEEPDELPPEQGDEPAGDGEASWKKDEDLVALVESYGLRADEFEGVSDADEIRRALRLIDRQFATAADRYIPVPGQPRPDAQSQVRPDEQPVSLDPQAYRDAGYDDETVRLVEVAARQQQELQNLQREMAGIRPVMEETIRLQRTLDQLEAKQEVDSKVNGFHDVVDAFDEKRYGRSIGEDGSVIRLNPVHDANRRELWQRAEQLALGIQAEAHRAGRTPSIPPLNVLLKRAEQLAFGDDIYKQARAEVTGKIAAQSKRRRPAAGRRRAVTTGGTVAKSSLQSVMDDPELKKVFASMQEENGDA